MCFSTLTAHTTLSNPNVLLYLFHLVSTNLSAGFIFQKSPHNSTGGVLDLIYPFYFPHYSTYKKTDGSLHLVDSQLKFVILKRKSMHVMGMKDIQCYTLFVNCFKFLSNFLHFQCNITLSGLWFINVLLSLKIEIKFIFFKEFCLHVECIKIGIFSRQIRCVPFLKTCAVLLISKVHK